MSPKKPAEQRRKSPSAGKQKKKSAGRNEPGAPLPRRRPAPVKLKKIHAPDLEELPTEDIWSLYRTSRKSRNELELERLRNVLMERHYPLVRYIAERLLQTLPKS